MNRNGIANSLSVTGSLSSGGGETRQLRLPFASQFPKLDTRIVHQTNDGEQRRVSARAIATHGRIIIDGDTGLIPEMTTDVIEPSASYVVENVKRERSHQRPWSRVGLGQLVGRMLGGHRAART